MGIRTNRTLFRHVPTRAITDADIVDLQTPTISGEGGTSLIAAAIDTSADNEEGQASGVYTTVDQLSDSLLTMSLVPRTRWQTLVNLDAIRVRLFYHENFNPCIITKLTCSPS